VTSAPGQSSGAAMQEMEKLIGQLPPRRGATSGLACRTRSASRALRRPFLYALSVLVVFLCLAALYEEAGRSRSR